MRPLNRGLIIERTKIAIAELEPAVKGFIGEIEALGRVAIMGGAIRDWAAGYQPRDIDFVVECPAGAMAKLMEPIPHTFTRYGGYRFVVGRTNIDMWPLESTWSLKLGFVPKPNFQIIVERAYFNMDSVLLALDDLELFEHHFIDGFNEKALAVNFWRNKWPPAITIARALRMSLRYDLRWSSAFQLFARTQGLKGLSWNDVADQYESRFGEELITSRIIGYLPPELQSWPTAK